MSPRVIRVPAASSPSVITSVTNLEEWHDAADTNTITSSSGSVSQWDDKSGNSRHVTQGTAADQPTTGATTLNAKNVIDFSEDYLVGGTTPLHSNTRGLTVFAVTTQPTTDSYWNVVSRYGASGDREWAVGPAANEMGLRISPDGVAFDNAQAGAAYTGFGIVRARWMPNSGAEVAVLTEGLEGIDADTYASLHTSTVPTEIGRFELSVVGFFSLAEVAIYSDYVDGQDSTDIATHLADKWGLTLV